MAILSRFYKVAQRTDEELNGKRSNGQFHRSCISCGTWFPSENMWVGEVPSDEYIYLCHRCFQEHEFANRQVLPRPFQRPFPRPKVTA
jgi:hypothetical protein